MNYRILLVEDDERISKSLAIRLRANGYEVRTAADSTLGMQAAGQETPDLIILDIMMPAGGGVWMAKNLRELPDTLSTPIIFVTASRDPRVRVEAATIPDVSFFEKPYDSMLLLDEIETRIATVKNLDPVGS